jgi:response regulator RpfG family c-di-GMP phosphodiesterase
MADIRINEKVILVDDDPNILAGYVRHLRKGLSVDVAQGGAQALEIMAKQGPYAVVVSDLKMPGMDGIELLKRVTEAWPDTVRIMLTGFADVDNAIAAVNEGHVFRFLTKPCGIETLARALAEAIKQYRLVRTEKDFLDQTLKGSVKALIGVMGLISPEMTGQSQRVAQVAIGMGTKLPQVDLWTLEMAALLSHIGMAASSVNISCKLNSAGQLNVEDLELLHSYSVAGAQVIRNIPRMEKVADTIYFQEKRMDGSGPPEEVTDIARVPLESRILKVAIDFERAVMQGKTPQEALAYLDMHRAWYDPAVRSALMGYVSSEMRRTPWAVKVSELNECMVLAQDVLSQGGAVLASAGQEVNELTKVHLGRFQRAADLVEPIKVFLSREDSCLEPPKAGG